MTRWQVVRHSRGATRMPLPGRRPGTESLSAQRRLRGAEVLADLSERGQVFREALLAERDLQRIADGGLVGILAKARGGPAHGVGIGRRRAPARLEREQQRRDALGEED